MIHFIKISKGIAERTCPACKNKFKIDSKKIKVISETDYYRFERRKVKLVPKSNYFGSYVCYSQELIVCPKCKKKHLTKKVKGFNSSYAGFESKENLIKK